MLLDTNILVDLLRSRKEPLALLLAAGATARISVITSMELRAGEKTLAERTAVERLNAQLAPIDISLGIAERAGELLKRYHKSHGLQAPDALIAATAEIHELPLVTLNVKHFPMFPDLKRPY